MRDGYHTGMINVEDIKALGETIQQVKLPLKKVKLPRKPIEDNKAILYNKNWQYKKYFYI